MPYIGCNKKIRLLIVYMTNKINFMNFILVRFLNSIFDLYTIFEEIISARTYDGLYKDSCQIITLDRIPKLKF